MGLARPDMLQCVELDTLILSLFVNVHVFKKSSEVINFCSGTGMRSNDVSVHNGNVWMLFTYNPPHKLIDNNRVRNLSVAVMDIPISATAQCYHNSCKVAFVK
jgi:hypothetical protein